MSAPTSDADRTLPLASRRLPSWLARSRTVLSPHGRLAYESRQWTGALVLVEAGAVVLEGSRGERVRLGEGAVLWLAGLPLIALHNPAGHAAVLIAITRRAAERDDEGERPGRDAERRPGP